MISSAKEFVQLRSSDDQSDQARATHDSAPISVWYDVIDRFPNFKPWVIHNKTVPLVILEYLANDPDPSIRSEVARKYQPPKVTFSDNIYHEILGINICL